MAKIRILHVVTRLEMGGAQKNVLQILSGLDPDRYEPYLVASTGPLAEEARQIPHLVMALTSWLRRRPNPVCDILAFGFLVYFIKKHRIQIVHTHSSKAGIVGRWAAYVCGVSVIVHTVHGWGFREFVKGPLNACYLFLEKGTAHITRRLIVVTEHDKEKGLRYHVGRADQYALIRYGLSADFCRPDPAAVTALKAQLEATDRYIVGMVACLKPQKNPLDFIRLAKRVVPACPGALFVLAGDGILRNEVEGLIRQEGLSDRVILLGWSKEISSFMAALDVFVLTSLWEGLPMVFLEAMSHAKPIVAYDICGNSEVVKDGVNGFLVSVGDVAELADRVIQLLEDDDLKRRMGLWGKTIVSDRIFLASTMMENLDQLYSGLLGETA